MTWHARPPWIIEACLSQVCHSWPELVTHMEQPSSIARSGGAGEKKGTSNGQAGKLLAWPAVIAIHPKPSQAIPALRTGMAPAAYSLGHVLQQEGVGLTGYVLW